MRVIVHVLTGLKIFVVADAVFSWFLRADEPPRSWTRAILDPLYAPLRRLLEPALGSVDLAPLLLLVVLHLAQLGLTHRRPRRQ